VQHEAHRGEAFCLHVWHIVLPVRFVRDMLLEASSLAISFNREFIRSILSKPVNEELQAVYVLITVRNRVDAFAHANPPQRTRRPLEPVILSGTNREILTNRVEAHDCEAR
jgi:hypothetical protein